MHLILITQGLWWRWKMRLMLFFAPTNTTCILKSMDHMIILTFKCYYWSNTFPKGIAAIDCDCSKAKSIKNFGKAFTILSSVQLSCSVVSDSLQPHGSQQARLLVHHQLPESTQTHLHGVSNAIQQSHPLSCPSPRAFNLSQHQGLFKWVSSSHCWLKNFSYNISPSNEHPGLISFKMDWLDLLAVQGTLKSLLQHHSSKTSILLHSAFFIVNFYIHTWLLEKP